VLLRNKLKVPFLLVGILNDTFYFFILFYVQMKINLRRTIVVELLLGMTLFKFLDSILEFVALRKKNDLRWLESFKGQYEEIYVMNLCHN